MDKSRRNFIKGAASTLAAASTYPQFAYSAPINTSSLAQMLSINPIDLEYKAGGPCCPICPGTTIVNHYLPVAFVEIVNGPVDSLIMDFSNISQMAQYSNIGSVDDFGSLHAVRIWDIPYYLIDAAMGGQGCKLCDRSNATPLPPQTVSVASSIAGEIACNGGNVMQEAINRIMNQLTAQFPLQCIPQLIYDSNYDPSWRTGCRDISTAASYAGISCDELSSTVLSSIGVDLDGGLSPCVGSWGHLYPRQMRSIGLDVISSAALSAYRALHIAGYSTGDFPYRVDLGGKLKWVSPTSTVAMTPGTPFEIFNAGQFVPPGEKFGFTWWSPVTCCKTIAGISSPCIPAIPCQGSSFY